MASLFQPMPPGAPWQLPEQPPAQAKAYDPSLYEQTAHGVGSLFRAMGHPYADRVGQEGAFGLDFTPWGVVTAIDEGQRLRSQPGVANKMMGGLFLGSAAIPAAGPAFRGAMRKAPKGIRAYHGSPHDFDKFSMEHIGTGEGAQAYGHGLYFAEAEGTAKAYRDQLQYKATGDPNALAVSYLDAYGQNRQSAISALHDHAATHGYDKVRANQLKDAADLLASEKPLSDVGRMYEVNINADPEDFLDWDKPLSEQPSHVRERFGWTDEKLAQYRETERVVDDNLLYELEAGGKQQPLADVDAASELANQMIKDIGLSPHATGQEALDRLARGYVNNDFGPTNKLGYVMTQKELARQGLPGIKYLDQGSRNLRDPDQLRAQIAKYESRIPTAPNSSARQEMEAARDSLQKELSSAENQSRNFVLFRDDIIEIVKKYGIAGAAAFTGMSQAEVAEAAGQGSMFTNQR